MYAILGKVAMTIVVLYLLFSVMSALRMYLVHSHYVHLEFAGKKWRSFGEWAPRQYRRLSVMKWLAVLMLVVWVGTLFSQSYA